MGKKYKRSPEKIINDIVLFDKRAIQVYDILADMEYKGLAYTEEYNKYIAIIQYIHEKEEEWYKDLDFLSKSENFYIDNIFQKAKLEEEDYFLILSILDDEFTGEKRFVLKTNYLRNENHETICSDDIPNNIMREYISEINYAIKTHSKPVLNTHNLNIDFESLSKDIGEEIISESIINLLLTTYAHTYIYYLNKEIEQTKSKRIKKELIKVKYRLIGMYPTLEDYFLEYSSIFYAPKLFQKIVENDTKEKGYFYVENYNNILENQVINALADFDSTDYESCLSQDDKIFYILESLLVKTSLSIMSSTESEFDIYVAKQNALKNANTNYGKRKILESFNIDEDYSIEKKVDL